MIFRLIGLGVIVAVMPFCVEGSTSAQQAADQIAKGGCCGGHITSSDDTAGKRSMRSKHRAIKKVREKEELEAQRLKNEEKKTSTFQS